MLEAPSVQQWDSGSMDNAHKADSEAMSTAFDGTLNSGAKRVQRAAKKKQAALANDMKLDTALQMCVNFLVHISGVEDWLRPSPQILIQLLIDYYLGRSHLRALRQHHTFADQVLCSASGCALQMQLASHQSCVCCGPACVQ